MSPSCESITPSSEAICRSSDARERLLAVSLPRSSARALEQQLRLLRREHVAVRLGSGRVPQLRGSVGREWVGGHGFPSRPGLALSGSEFGAKAGKLSRGDKPKNARPSNLEKKKARSGRAGEICDSSGRLSPRRLFQRIPSRDSSPRRGLVSGRKPRGPTISSAPNSRASLLSPARSPALPTIGGRSSRSLRKPPSRSLRKRRTKPRRRTPTRSPSKPSRRSTTRLAKMPTTSLTRTRTKTPTKMATNGRTPWKSASGGGDSFQRVHAPHSAKVPLARTTARGCECSRH